MTNQKVGHLPPAEGEDVTMDILLKEADMDPAADPNAVRYCQNLKALETLYNELPDGWTRNYDNGSAPFVHVDGRESFRHPNRALIRAAAEEFQAAQSKKAENFQKKRPTSSSSTVAPANNTNRALVKKLRMMVQTGIPMEAVEHRAKLEGINLSVILGGEGETKQQESSSDDDDAEESMMIPTPLLKKYKRMIKSGVPLKGVQAQAFVDGQWDPQQVVEALKDVLDQAQKENIQKSEEEEEEPYYQPRRTQLPRRPFAGGAAAKPKYFHCNADGSIEINRDSLLAALVRKMAQTVQKRSTFTKKVDASDSMSMMMVVDSLTLYHALGALQGVQMARDRYNSTIGSICDLSKMSFQEIKAKRQAFQEIAKTIGMDLNKEEESSSGPADIPGLDDLVLHIQNSYSKELKALHDLVHDGYYDFDSLALVYAPGSKVVAKNAGGGGVDMICQVAWNRYEQGRTIMGQPVKYFKVCFQYVVAVDASQATMAEVVEGMESFEGRRNILQSPLIFMPMMAYSKDEQEDLLNFYRHRGTIFNQVALRGKHAYMAYDKGSFFLKRSGGPIEQNSGGSTAAALATGGRIIVDTQGAYDNGHTLGVGYDPMVLGIKYKHKEYNLLLRSSKHQQKGGDSGVGAANTNKQGKNSGGDSGGGGLILFDQVPSDFLDMVWPLVVGFSLSAKGWGDVLLDGLEEIQWKEDIFDRLVLPENRKMMVKALVRHSTADSSFHDLVEGKGEGTLFLMYGPPGTGKTLTAEAVAELLHKPLYSLSLGSLGTTAAELERRLGEIMVLSARWDALILLDEADSFLETRSSTSSLERNAMVSVMLKLVEYFSGILFLTSNRIDSLDPAFQTRITLALRYEPLDKEARAQVWTNLLLKSGFKSMLEFGAIDPFVLAEASLNGREIKNALRLAMAMASEKGEPLSQTILLETVEIVIDYKVAIHDYKVDKKINPYAAAEDEKEEDGKINHGCFFRWWGK